MKKTETLGDDTIIKLKDYQLGYLKTMLESVPRESLFIKDKTTSCGDKWQALTLGNKIIKMIETVNFDFEENVIKKVNVILGKFENERREMLAEFEAIKEGGSEEDKRKKAKEQEKFKIDWSKRQNDELEMAGYKVFAFPFGRRGVVLFVKLSNDDNAKEVEIKFEKEFNQFAFVKEQFDNFYQLPISNEILAEVSQYFL
jgi:hypothetical protein